jgi:HK97 family phage prohead protease
MEAADFSGYATKVGLKCSDGRTIMPGAFEHEDGVRVPLVWQHGHNDPKNVVGHAILEHRDDGVYAYGFFNDTDSGRAARELVRHKDIDKLSIYANKLVEKAKQVFHGRIREVSLVLAGANPGALIDNVAVAHADGDIDVLEDEAIITTGEYIEIFHSDEDVESEAQHAEDEGDDDGRTVEDVYNSLTEEQKNVVHYMIGAALESVKGSDDSDGEAKQSAVDETDDTSDEGSEDTSGEPKVAALSHTEGSEEMTRNVFEQDGNTSAPGHSLSHADVASIVQAAKRSGSMKAAVEDYALQHGIENLDVLFPDAKLVGEVELDKRRTEWVSSVMGAVRKSPFARVKSASADLTYEDARAKGYVTGALKKEEFFSVSKRVTTPQTVYKKQKLDRDDIIDITDLNVVSWMKAEMRMMLEEEIARAILVGDGRSGGDADKIQETNIRPIATDHSFYAHPVEVNLGDGSSSYTEVVDAVVRARRFYKGSGTPTAFVSESTLAELMLLKDGDGYRLYKTEAELASALRVRNVVEVEVLEEHPDIIAIIVNLADYVVGSDKGGETTMFDDFDIDYNQYKYLIETRLCGALTKPHSALVVKSVDAADVAATVVDPVWDPATYTVTIPALATAVGVEYTNDEGVAYDNDGQTVDDVLTAGEVLKVWAQPLDGYFIAPGTRTSWSFLRPTGS